MSLTYPDDRTYHAEHLWAKPEADGTMLVGITDYAQDQLGGGIFKDQWLMGVVFCLVVSPPWAITSNRACPAPPSNP